MKTLALMLVCAVMMVASGCAQKTESEKLRDDMNKAADKLSKEMKGFTN